MSKPELLRSGMTYYEELGISADASAEEIRQAHRRLVKLLHPDPHQDDDNLRRLAEIQLVRLNGIVAELLDPARRATYDASLSAALLLPQVALQPPGVSGQQPPVATSYASGLRLAAFALAVVGILALISVRSPTDIVRSVPSGDNGAPAPAAGSDPTTAANRGQRNGNGNNAGRSASSSNRSSRANNTGSPNRDDQEPGSSAADPQPDPTVRGANHNNNANPDPAAAPPVPAAAASALPAPAQQQQQQQQQQPAAAPAANSLAGTWLYAGGTPTERDAGLYKPEFIELRIRESAPGALYGDFRSRYAVHDLAIPPSVNFTFEGNANGGSWRWRGPKGSTGTLTIRRLHQHAIQIDWKVTAFGEDATAGLESGTATLVRRL